MEENLSALRRELISFTRRKFASRRNIADLAEDIVNDVIFDVAAKNGNETDKLNFGYLSVACVRVGYKYFRKWGEDKAKSTLVPDCLYFLPEKDVVDELLKCEETEAVLNSLRVLKAIEKEVVLGRYYGDLKFSEIASALGLNLNTVLSHHRRALEKLRPVLSKYFYEER